MLLLHRSKVVSDLELGVRLALDILNSDSWS